MNISEGSLVEINYTLEIEGGEVVESSTEEGPLQYLHGGGEIPDRLEEALLGKSIGDKLELTLAPEDAFGDYDLEALTTVPRSEFPEDAELEKDTWIQVEVMSDDGELLDGENELEMRVAEVSDDSVVLDANHPLAGKTITYKVEVRELRMATEADLDDRHEHGEDCSH
ncbi:MAG: FKBP-type peptidyl-prolyl cis-trans isomerase SlyD [Candidatus Paceibacteria bacterium]|jgi:FKBP-type peptidyl-prolyl cis-trans isomerase SlyD